LYKQGQYPRIFANPAQLKPWRIWETIRWTLRTGRIERRHRAAGSGRESRPG